MRSSQLVNHYDPLGLKQHELHSLLARGMALPSWLREWLYRSTQTILLTLQLQYKLLQVFDIGLMSLGNISVVQSAIAQPLRRHAQGGTSDWSPQSLSPVMLHLAPAGVFLLFIMITLKYSPLYSQWSSLGLCVHTWMSGSSHLQRLLRRCLTPAVHPSFFGSYVIITIQFDGAVIIQYRSSWDHAHVRVLRTCPHPPVPSTSGLMINWICLQC